MMFVRTAWSAWNTCGLFLFELLNLQCLLLWKHDWRGPEVIRGDGRALLERTENVISSCPTSDFQRHFTPQELVLGEGSSVHLMGKSGNPVTRIFPDSVPLIISVSGHLEPRAMSRAHAHFARPRGAVDSVYGEIEGSHGGLKQCFSKWFGIFWCLIHWGTCGRADPQVLNQTHWITPGVDSNKYLNLRNFGLESVGPTGRETLQRVGPAFWLRNDTVCYWKEKRKKMKTRARKGLGEVSLELDLEKSRIRISKEVGRPLRGWGRLEGNEKRLTGAGERRVCAVAIHRPSLAKRKAKLPNTWPTLTYPSMPFCIFLSPITSFLLPVFALRRFTVS